MRLIEIMTAMKRSTGYLFTRYPAKADTQSISGVKKRAVSGYLREIGESR
jgi:hypothetical protein